MIGGAIGAYGTYKASRAAGMNTGESFVAAATGLRVDSVGMSDWATHNNFQQVLARGGPTYLPPIVGVGVSTGVGGKSLYGLGFGLGLNSKMPKGFKL